MDDGPCGFIPDRCSLVQGASDSGRVRPVQAEMLPAQPECFHQAEMRPVQAECLSSLRVILACHPSALCVSSLRRLR